MTVPTPFEEDLRRAAEGDVAARQRLWADHYELLHACAAEYLARQWRDADAGLRISLGATDVVHEAYLRLQSRVAVLENGSRYFFRAFHQECMRIVVEHYRRTKNHRGRGRAKRIPFESELVADRRPLDLETVVDAITALQRKDERAGQIAYLRVFEGRTIAECAELLDFGMRTVEADWSFAKAYLERQLRA